MHRRGFQRRIFWVNMRRVHNGTNMVRIRPFVIILILLFIALMVLYEVQLRPMLEDYAKTQTRNMINLMANHVIEKEISDGQITYQNLVTAQKDAEGHIMSLTTNIPAMNKLKVRVEGQLIEQILEKKDLRIYIPMGNLFGSPFLSGRGPRIPIKIVPVTEVYASYDNTFTSAGINQTRHQIIMKFDIKVGMMLPGRIRNTVVQSQVCVAETIIVGATPQFFAGTQK